MLKTMPSHVQFYITYQSSERSASSFTLDCLGCLISRFCQTARHLNLLDRPVYYFDAFQPAIST